MRSLYYCPFFLICLLYILPAFHPIFAIEPLLTEDFSSGKATNWEPFLNYPRLADKQWYVEDGQYYHNQDAVPTQQAHDAQTIYTKGSAWTDLVYEADVAIQHGLAGLWFRAQMAPDLSPEGAGHGKAVSGYYFVTQPVDRSLTDPASTEKFMQFKLMKLKNDVDCGQPDCSSEKFTNHFSTLIKLAEYNLPDVYEHSFRLKVVLKGMQIECYFNNQLIFTFTDPDTTYAQGSVGLRVYRALASFDNITVTPLGPITTSPTPSPTQSTTTKNTYATFVSQGGAFITWDTNQEFTDPYYNALFNKAFSFLTKPSETTKQSLRELFLVKLPQAPATGHANRQLTDILELYLLPQIRELFLESEAKSLEQAFLARVQADVGASGEPKYQHVNRGEAAVMAHILRTGPLASQSQATITELVQFARAAKDKEGRPVLASFEYSDSIVEDSLHYASYLVKTMIRIFEYTDLKSNPSAQANLDTVAQWYLATFPHTGFRPSFGVNWYADGLDDWHHDALLYFSYALKASNPTLSAQCKWLAEKMFNYSQGIGQKYFKSNPAWLWQYYDDTITSQQPTTQSIVTQRTLAIHEDYQANGLPFAMPLKDKLILRTGWDDDDLYVMVDLVGPTVIKSEGTPGSVVALVLGKESVLTGHTWDNNPQAQAWQQFSGAGSARFTDNISNVSINTLNGKIIGILNYAGKTREIVLDPATHSITFTDKGFDQVTWQLQQDFQTQTPESLDLTIRGTSYKLTTNTPLSLETKLTSINTDYGKRYWGYLSSSTNQVVLSSSTQPIQSSFSYTPPASPTPTGSCLVGDADCNGIVNILDFSIWRQESLTQNGRQTQSPYWKADFNADELVNILDFSLWKQESLEQ